MFPGSPGVCVMHHCLALLPWAKDEENVLSSTEWTAGFGAWPEVNLNALVHNLLPIYRVVTSHGTRLFSKLLNANEQGRPTGKRQQDCMHGPCFNLPAFFFLS